jgi:hypothetical protein
MSVWFSDIRSLSDSRLDKHVVHSLVSHELSWHARSAIVHVLRHQLLRQDSLIEDRVLLQDLSVLALLLIQPVLQISDLVR